MADVLNIAVLQSPGDLGDSRARQVWLKKQLMSDIAVHSDLLILPELFQCGYHAGSCIVNMAEESDGLFANAMAKLAIEHNIAIAYGYAESHEGLTYNSAQCIDRSGAIIGHHRKLLPPPGFEADIFSQGNAHTVFELGKFTLSMLICYDFEFPENVRQVAAMGADLVLVPTALSDQWGIVSEKLAPTRAFENGVFVAYANHCGTENNLQYYGGSCIVGPDGSEVSRAGKHCQMINGAVKKSMVLRAQKRMPYLSERFKITMASNSSG